ncbi:MAG: haloacid dehalogenase type II [Acetobacteraceae bacterium]|nr:haloacid dehalogenase type II [Acetobacteraceae bacterium]
MSEAARIKQTVKLCMFDQYGTVVDMQTGLWEVAVDFLKAKRWTGNAYAFVTWWRRTHFENSMVDALLGRTHTSYREIGHLSLRHVLERAAIPHTDDEVRFLVSCIERLKPFPEVPAALDRLRGRYGLVVLSNGDPDMLDAARAHHRIAFDRLISASEANAFKPHVATYKTAADICGVAPADVLFIANHEFDCVGAKSAGMRTAFIDRRRRPFARWPHQPDLIVPTMTALAELIA